MKRLHLLFAFLITCFISHAEVYDIAKLGADTQGGEKCTDIINRAIEQAALQGGGTIYFPAGKYLTGPIHLKSNITINIEAGAVLQFSSDFDDYLPYVKVRYEGIFMNTFNPLFYAVDAENIAIKGEGTIDGGGSHWWSAVRDIMADVRKNGRVTEPDKYQQRWKNENPELVDSKYTANQFFRPPFIQFIECNNVDIEGITIKNSPFWTVNPIGCNDVRITGVSIFNPEDGYNTDGINPSSCSNVRISDCFISVGDDCVTIKSGRDHFGREYGKPCENITITNCVMLAGHGGVVIGSEMSGGVRNVSISNCVFDGTDNGIRIKSARGRGGVVENLRVNNIVMRNIRNLGFVFNLRYDRGTSVEAVSERTPIFRNIHISAVTGVGIGKVGALSGIEEMPVREVSFDNITMEAKEGFSAETAENLQFTNIDITVQEGPALQFRECKGLSLSDIRSKAPLANQPLLTIASCENVLVNDCWQKVPADLFLQVDATKLTWGTNFMDLVKESVRKVE